MRIVIVSHSDVRYGADRAAYRLLRALRGDGADAAMLVQDRFADDPDVIGPATNVEKGLGRLRPHLDRLPNQLYPSRQAGMLFSSGLWPALTFKRINALRPDLVNLHWVAGGMLPVESLPLINAPIVWTLHDCWPFTGGCHYPQECRRFEERCGRCPILGSSRDNDLARLGQVRRARVLRRTRFQVVTPSRWLATTARQSRLFRDLPIEVIPNSLDLERYRPYDKQLAREWLGLPADRRLILFGAIDSTADRRKGYDLLLQALEQLGAAGWKERATLLVFGSSAGESLKGFDTRFLGRIYDDTTLALIYAAADCFVAPSRQDNLPNTVLESLACGTPVVGFQVGGIPDMVQHLQTGYLAPAEDALQLAQGIEALLVDPERCASMGHSARSAIEQHFSPALQAERYLALFSDLLRRGVQ